MSFDRMADEIAKKQRKAWEAMYDPMEVTQRRYEIKERFEKQRTKNQVLQLLSEDLEFRKEVAKLLKPGLKYKDQ